MKRILILSMAWVCIIPTQAQLLKKLKSKVDQSAKEVKTKVKEKMESAPDRVVDHTANKVQTKAETNIDNKENKVNGRVDKTVDQVDSIKIKKAKDDAPVDTTQNKTGIGLYNNVKNTVAFIKLQNFFRNYKYATVLIFNRSKKNKHTV